MKATIYTSESRGDANHGWLHSRHTFSFAAYHNPDRMHFGLMRVLNDDIVAPGMGFGLHPHDNMEIVSIPLKGELKHRDTTGREAVIRTGDVQIMSAGSGLQHSEVNNSKSEEVHFLQIWIFPKERNIKPRYDQKTFETTDRVNQWQVVVSPNEYEGGVWINQDAWFSISDLNGSKELSYKVHKPGNGLYLFVLEGSIDVEGNTLNHRDAIGISDFSQVELKALSDSQLLAIEVPMN